MKTAILLIMLTLSSQAFSDCSEDYSKFVTKKAIAAPLSTLGVIPAGYLSLGTFIIGGWGGSMPVVGLAALSTTGTGYLMRAGISNSVAAISYSGVLSLLEDTKVGMGQNLSDITEELSDDLDREISEKEVASILKDGNDSKLFCQEESLFSHSDIYEYLLATLE